jgi:hypothetical protein
VLLPDSDASFGQEGGLNLRQERFSTTHPEQARQLTGKEQWENISEKVYLDWLRRLGEEDKEWRMQKPSYKLSRSWQKEMGDIRAASIIAFVEHAI